MSFFLKTKFFDELPNKIELDEKKYRNVGMVYDYLKIIYNLDNKDYIILYNGKKAKESHSINQGEEFLLFIPVFGG